MQENKAKGPKVRVTASNRRGFLCHFAVILSLAVVNGLDVLRREVAHSSVAPAPPARLVGAVHKFNDVAAQEPQLRLLVRGEVEQSVGVVGALQKKTRNEELAFHLWIVLYKQYIRTKSQHCIL